MPTKPLSQWIQGTWTLVSFILEGDAGHGIAVMGPGATGYVAYGADGWMSFQISAADRKPFDVPDMNGGTPEQTIAAARSFLAYAGPYEVDETGEFVIQHVAQCLIPNWIGDAHKRYVARGGDNGLTLSSDPFPIDGAPHRLVLRFDRRVSGPAH